MNENEHATRTSDTTDRSLPEEVEVAIVGAGPTGLTLGGMLSGYGIRTAVLDGAQGPARHSRAAVVHARTLETLEPLGVVGEMLGGGVAYRSGWSVDDSQTVERWSAKGQGPLPGLDPALALVVPEHQAKRAAEDVARFRTLPVRVVPRAHLAHAALVRPDGYVAGCAAPDQNARLLELLARALGA